MPLIDDAALMEVLAGLFEASRAPDVVPADSAADSAADFAADFAADSVTRGADSFLGAPMAALAAAPRTFAQVYGTDGLLAHLAARAAADGDDRLAGLIGALDRALSDGSLEVTPRASPAPRLLRFVYPVV